MAQNSCSSSYHHNGIPASGKREGEVDGRPLPFKGMALKQNLPLLLLSRW